MIYHITYTEHYVTLLILDIVSHDISHYTYAKHYIT